MSDLAGDRSVEVDGRAVPVSSLERVLWPRTGTTKADLLAYYLRVAPLLLPHLAARPLTLHRFPHGVTGRHFFQTRTPPHPGWLRTARLAFPRTGSTFEAPVIDDLAGLVWAVNLSTIELHPFLAHREHLATPLVVVFDLDPGPPADLLEAARVALLLRDVLAAAGLAAYPKTSGSKGLHVTVPLHTAVTYAETKAFARAVARQLTAANPDLVIDRMPKTLRAGRVLIDWSQNDPGKTTVAPYSLRGLPVPTVATPLTWEEITTAVQAADPQQLAFGPTQILERIARLGDLAAPLLSSRQRLPAH